jgi:hypothetical protein
MVVFERVTPAEDSMENDIIHRLEKLETENRRMKKIGIVAGIVVSMFIVGGQAKTARVVEANEFRLVDASGKVRGKFSTNDAGQTLLTLTDSTEQISASLGTGTEGSSLVLSAMNINTWVHLSTPKGIFGGLHMIGPGGKLDVTLDDSNGGPNLSVEDKEGYSSVIGRSDLVLTKTGKKEQTPAASLVLFNKDKKVLWSAP